ncbi:MAG: hypothetical protein E7173_01545 [Firmicutes bacterium]|nr:hypothetical protein [Bacillota bacterium]
MYGATLKILKKINTAGFKSYVVGGYVRDLYLNRHSMDVDICTNATPQELKEIFGGAMLPSVNYGSVTIVYNKIRFEITTFRKELKYENNRLPIKIKYIDSLLDDVKRRDFTINTLCMDENGEIIDLLGAIRDLDDKVIRMVGNPKKRLKEDALRILRAIRFATILNFRLDDNLKKYIKKYGHLLKKLSYYRKQTELEKIFSSSNAHYGISLLKELELVESLELSNIDNLVITPSLIGIWSQLGVEDIYGFSKHDKETIKGIQRLLELDLYDSKILYHYGLYNCSIAAEILKLPKKIVTKKYNDLVIHSTNDIMIKGNDIAQILNRKPGPYIKEIIEDLENSILDHVVENQFESLKSYIVNKYGDVQNK